MPNHQILFRIYRGIDGLRPPVYQRDRESISLYVFDRHHLSHRDREVDPPFLSFLFIKSNSFDRHYLSLRDREIDPPSLKARGSLHPLDDGDDGDDNDDGCLTLSETEILSLSL